MSIMVFSLAFVAAALAAATMGYAIQRGATCTVAAIAEIVEHGRARRLLSLGEAALWVAGGLVVAQSFGLLGRLPHGHTISPWTVAGGVLLGLGAYINGACVFGAIARLGSGHWAYALTPIGYFAGVATFGSFGLAMMSPVRETGAVTFASPWLAAAFGVFALYRLARLAGVFAGSRDKPLPARLAGHVWAPHEATIVIGITFVVLFLSVGAWTYTDLLADLAQGMVPSLPGRIALFVMLIGGACLGGWTAGLLGRHRVSTAQLAKCFAGGLLMGWGSLMIPGGNDGLILVGLPLLWPNAWVGIAAMALTIYAAFMLARLAEGMRLKGAT